LRNIITSSANIMSHDLEPSALSGVAPAYRGRCWIVTPGVPGLENQCLGLAEALGAAPEVKRIKIRSPWRHLMPGLWLKPFAALDLRGDSLVPPWPDLLIASGRVTVALSVAIRRASQGKTFTVQIQSPAVWLDRFDLIIAPAHDRLEGANIVSTTGGLHRVTPERLAAAAATIAPGLAHLPRPRFAVLLGGPNKAYRFEPDFAAELGMRLSRIASETGGSLLITPSRRTGAANVMAIRQAVADAKSTIWNGRGTNPYYGYLGAADAIIVTADSVNMVSEATTTGKPVFVIDLPGPGSRKFRAFHAGLREAGLTRPFDGSFASWTYAPLNDVQRAADALRARLIAAGRWPGA
jgi:mitochondrial fission protein ELM1